MEISDQLLFILFTANNINVHTTYLSELYNKKTKNKLNKYVCEILKVYSTVLKKDSYECVSVGDRSFILMT